MNKKRQLCLIFFPYLIYASICFTEKFKLVRENTGFNDNCTGQEYVDSFPGDLSACAETVVQRSKEYKGCTDTFFFSNSSGDCMCETAIRNETCARENSTEFNEYIAITGNYT